MGEIKKEYSNDEITVVWKPKTCIHSKKCWNGLGAVFQPQEKPWIKTDGASSEEIMAQIDQCPSGALSYYKNGEDMSDTNNESNMRVEVMKNGPLLVHGDFTLKGKDGNEEQKSKVTALCRCGESANKPYCDGTHNTCGFKDE